MAVRTAATTGAYLAAESSAAILAVPCLSEEPSMPQRSMQPSPAGWYDDPYEAGKLRYFDGARWTDHVETDNRRSPA
ncbi:DUF2510 domain-containing protein [Rugosimonospora africana]|uniref:DUF2510 domain-containing protein n=1 Tax=Rugosimonospora africana TaxID=556532 RepID=A0A8J3QSP8_9ACTN|nr:hypothetical protein Raf01_49270 [Rugosimonospora africana]